MWTGSAIVWQCELVNASGGNAECPTLAARQVHFLQSNLQISLWFMQNTLLLTLPNRTQTNPDITWFLLPKNISHNKPQMKAIWLNKITYQYLLTKISPTLIKIICVWKLTSDTGGCIGCNRVKRDHVAVDARLNCCGPLLCGLGARNLKPTAAL